MSRPCAHSHLGILFLLAVATAGLPDQALAQTSITDLTDGFLGAGETLLTAAHRILTLVFLGALLGMTGYAMVTQQVPAKWALTSVGMMLILSLVAMPLARFLTEGTTFSGIGSWVGLN